MTNLDDSPKMQLIEKTASDTVIDAAFDYAMAETGLFYSRFMDDWLIIAPNRWKLKKEVCVANQILNALKVEKQHYQTFIGRASKGFDFLGYHLKPGGLTVAAGTIAHHIANVSTSFMSRVQHHTAFGNTFNGGRHRLSRTLVS